MAVWMVCGSAPFWRRPGDKKRPWKGRESDLCLHRVLGVLLDIRLSVYLMLLIMPVPLRLFLSRKNENLIERKNEKCGDIWIIRTQRSHLISKQFCIGSLVQFGFIYPVWTHYYELSELMLSNGYQPVLSLVFRHSVIRNTCIRIHSVFATTHLPPLSGPSR